MRFVRGFVLVENFLLLSLGFMLEVWGYLLYFKGYEFLGEFDESDGVFFKEMYI